MKTLHVSSSVQKGGYLFPVSSPEFLDELFEAVVLEGRPPMFLGGGLRCGGLFVWKWNLLKGGFVREARGWGEGGVIAVRVGFGEAVAVFGGTSEEGERRVLALLFCLHSMNDNAITAKFINSPHTHRQYSTSKYKIKRMLNRNYILTKNTQKSHFICI